MNKEFKPTNSIKWKVKRYVKTKHATRRYWFKGFFKKTMNSLRHIQVIGVLK